MNHAFRHEVINSKIQTHSHVAVTSIHDVRTVNISLQPLKWTRIAKYWMYDDTHDIIALML